MMPKAPDATDHQERDIEFFYDMCGPGYVALQVTRFGGAVKMERGDGRPIREQWAEIMFLPDGYQQQFDAEIKLLQSWAIIQDRQIQGMPAGIGSDRRYLLHTTPMVEEVLQKMDYGGIMRVARKAEALLAQYKTVKGGFQFSALVEDTKGNLLNWPLETKKLGVVKP